MSVYKTSTLMKLNETMVSVTIALCLANGHKEWYHQLQIFGSYREKKIIQALHTGKVWKDNMLSIVSCVLNKDSATFLFNAKAKLLLYYFPSHGMGRMKLKQAYGARWHTNWQEHECIFPTKSSIKKPKMLASEDFSNNIIHIGVIPPVCLTNNLKTSVILFVVKLR